MMKRLMKILFLFPLLVQICHVYGQVDTLEADKKIQNMSMGMQAFAASSSIQALSATVKPAISYGSAQTFTPNQQIDWSPTNSGGAAEFVVTVEQTLTNYYNPLNTFMGSDGSLYIANAGYHSIMKRTAAGTETVFAGGNSTAWDYVDGTGTAARFRHPSTVAMDAGGNLFVTDQQNHRIRKITPAGVVSTFAGSGTAGATNGTGTAASFNNPMGLAFDASGNLYVADGMNHLIRKITAAGVVSTYAGTGTLGLQDGALLSAQFNSPMGLAFDTNGDLYIADRQNHALRKIVGGIVSTIAGNGTSGNVDGQGSAARFYALNNLVVKGGNIYVVDMNNNALRYVSPTGAVITISTSGMLSNPFGISTTLDGKYYITENLANQIKKVAVKAAYSISPALPAGLIFDASTGKISGKIATLTASQSYTVTALNGIGSSTATVSFSIANPPVSGFSASTDQNYVVERTIRKAGLKTVAAVIGRTVDSVNVSIQYFDGLGRSLQSIQWQGSPLKNDIVQYSEYDAFGRESKKYLPYVKNMAKDGSFKTTSAADQVAYYATTNTWDAHIKKMTTPFSVTVFESSPLNRVQQQGAPGLAWQPAANRETVTTASTTGHTTVTEYGTNVASDIKLWSMKPTNNGATSTFYAANKLYKKVSKDENWVKTTGKQGTVEEFKDFEGHIILKRIWETDVKKLETYYVYDDFGNLRYVIPPGYTTGTVTDNDADFKELIYAYRYDAKQRLIEKKVPGKGWEWLVYNGSDQVILTQDSVQRGKPVKEWSYTKYDALGRVVITGIYKRNYVNQAAAQKSADSVVVYWEERSIQTKLVGTVKYTKYTNNAFPKVAAQMTPLTVNYYDDYLFEGGDTTKLAAVGITKSTKLRGLATGTKVYQDNGTLPLWSISYYDDYGRVIQSASQNHLLGVDLVTNTYSFTGELLTTKREHKPVTGTATTVLTTNIYDHVGRLLTTKKKVNAQAEIIQSKLAYNEIGQLKSKDIHSENNGTNFLTNMAYSYNERGWGTKTSSPQFTYELNYNVNSAGSTVLPNAQYNGNIAQQLWGHAATTSSIFTYTYDGLNRLKNGTSTGTIMSEALTYDDMGNIRTLTRNIDNTTTTSTTTYTYNNANKSNRLLSLTGGLTGTFTYDGNGNATKDRTGMAFIYNQLNLPKSATITGRTVTYLYDAEGNKLKKTAVVGAVTTEQDYVNGIEYSKLGAATSTIDRIATEEGFLLNGTGTYSYYYNLTDNLGNVRSVIKQAGTPTVPVVAVVQKQDYYPFGKTKPIATSINNKYLYNGKEMQDDLSLGTHTLGSSYVFEGQLDYGARFYDAEIGRWNVVDPNAALYGSHSPYAYGFNNPVMVIDPNGKDGIVTGTGTLDDPFRIKANYYYYDLEEDQVAALNKAIAEYNNGGNAHTFKDKDGTTYFSVFELKSIKVDAQDAGTAHDFAYKDKVEVDGKEYQYGNVISNGQSSGKDIGNATSTTVKINREKVENLLTTNPGGDKMKLMTGTFVHEIGHNLGASHGDPGSIMSQLDIKEIGKASSSGEVGTGTYNYKYPTVNSSGIRAIMGRVGNPNSLESMYLTPKEVRNIIKNTDSGAPGAIYKAR
ncbi:DUF6443 domain-containing protein [Sphingobacterium sp. SRCM116780]|uniref:DUF6443 domain-containing protein n=1 Tax=Sphingobacterium sp. SRCM116780 TaxID=2907623 RepID=UPI001F3257B7|nr:DUF6443 domain-containing protein [Sphingobacterium sp. SRCM116780]UIR57796.1 DUF6443 domain-containing protein [Sphingobacterium sp. SRCM116780]